MAPEKNFRAERHRRPVVSPPKWDGIPTGLRDVHRRASMRLVRRKGNGGSGHGATGGIRAARVAGGCDGVGFVLGD